MPQVWVRSLKLGKDIAVSGMRGTSEVRERFSPSEGKCVPTLKSQGHSTTRGAALLVFVVIMTLIAPAYPTRAADAPSLAFLGIQFQNDNEDLEPTTDAEHARLKRTETEFIQQLAASGRYRIVPTLESMRAKIAAGQQVGQCGGCEIDFGKELGVIPGSTQGLKIVNKPPR